MNSGALIDPADSGGWRLISTGDFDLDGQPDLAFQLPSTGDLGAWLMDGVDLVTPTLLGAPLYNPGPGWTFVGTGDFDRDSETDLLFQYLDGSMAVWYLNGLNYDGGAWINPSNYGADPSNWKVVATGDFNGDRKVDIALQHIEGEIVFRMLDGVSRIQDYEADVQNTDSQWQVVAAANTSENGATDLFFQHTIEEDLLIWPMRLDAPPGTHAWPMDLDPKNPNELPGLTWKLVAP